MARVQATFWLMNHSQSNVVPTKMLDDQIAAHEMGDKDFWPYDGAPSESASTLYQFKEGPNATFVESLKAKHNRDTANPQYVTVETSRKKAKAATSPVQISKQH
jgi:hypothetical protein